MPDEAEITDRTVREVRLTGNPGHGYPPYDFTWRTGDADDDPQFVAAIQFAGLAIDRGWTDLQLQIRAVRTVTAATPWHPVALPDPAEIGGGG